MLDLDTAMENKDLYKLVRFVLEKHIKLPFDEVQVAIMPRLLSCFEMNKLYEEATTAKEKFDTLAFKLDSELKTRRKLNIELSELFNGVKEAESKLLQLVNSSEVQKLHEEFKSFSEAINVLRNEELIKSAKQVQRILNNLEHFTKEPKVKRLPKEANPS